MNPAPLHGPRNVFILLMVEYAALAVIVPGAPAAAALRIAAFVTAAGVGVAMARSSRIEKGRARVRINGHGTSDQASAAKILLGKVDAYEYVRAAVTAAALFSLTFLVVQMCAVIRLGAPVVPAVGMLVCSLGLLWVAHWLVDRQQDSLSDTLRDIIGSEPVTLACGELDTGAGYKLVASNFSTLPKDTWGR